jgi:hypothetical protein
MAAVGNRKTCQKRVSLPEKEMILPKKILGKLPGELLGELLRKLPGNSQECTKM